MKFDMDFQDIPVKFKCGDSWLYGIISMPNQAAERGVLIVVGGPQYRAGSHRQFVLLARDLAAKGIAVMRFDLRGMGDSEGDKISFASADEDIKCALDQFAATASSLKEFVIWGLCDAATAASLYAPADRRVCGLVLLNPWIRTEDGMAQTYLRHYYASRIFQREFWQKILSGKLNIYHAIGSFVRILGKAFRGKNEAKALDANSANTRHTQSLPEQMCDGLTRFNGSILFVLSGKDFTAKEFATHVENSDQWRHMLRSKNAAWKNLEEANHTFSREVWRNQVSAWTHEWIKTF